ncbi:MAG: glycosyltransferase [Myxococcales bacterium]|nr:glycosyltransferase [Myxococcales bacterium]
MASPGDYLRPGISVVSIARGEDTKCEDLTGFLSTTLPYVEQVCVTVDTRELLEVALDAGPKLRVRMLASETNARAAWAAAAHMADHEWSFALKPAKRLQPASYDLLRRALPYAGREVVAIPETGCESGGVPRLWRTAWNLAPDGLGRLERSGPAAHRPAGRIAIDQIPVPRHAGKLSATSAAPRSHPAAQTGPVLVCGMHRSGTSMTTRVLNLLGVALGDQLAGVHTAADPSNEKGHWEDLQGQALHARIQKNAIGVRTDWEWLADSVVTPRKISKTSFEELRQLSHKMSAHGRWGIKDPRLSLLLPTWWLAAPEACVVLCVRDPLAVAQSLRARDCLSLADGLRAWRFYNTHALHCARKQPERLLVVHYETLMSQLAPEVNRLARFLGYAAEPTQEQLASIRAFVDSEMKHQTGSENLRRELEATFGAHAVSGEIDAICALHAHLHDLSKLPVADTGSAKPAQPSRADANGAACTPSGKPKHSESSLRLSVVMPYYENERTLEASLRSFCSQGLDPSTYEIVVVDDGSRAPARPIVEALQLPVATRVFDGCDNRGQSAATNRGIQHAEGHLVFLTCADIIAHQDLLQAHLRAHAERSERVGVGGAIPYADHIEMTPFMEYLATDGPQFAFGTITDGDDMSPGCCYAPNFSARRHDLIECGLFDERLVYGYQDTDLGVRLKTSGVRLLYRPKAIAYHDHPNDLTNFCERNRQVARSFWLMADKHPGFAQQGRLRQALVHDLAHMPPLADQIRAAEALAIEVAADPEAGRSKKPELHRRYKLALHRAFLEGLTENQARVDGLLRAG